MHVVDGGVSHNDLGVAMLGVLITQVEYWASVGLDYLFVPMI